MNTREKNNNLKTRALNVLVTGGTGFIGQRLLALLKKEGCNIFLMTRNSSFYANAIPFSLNSKEIQNGFLEKIDCIFHLAGIAHDLNKAFSEDDYFKINSQFTIQLADLAATNKVKSFVFVSSVKASCHPNKGKCLSEDYQCKPESYYGLSKRNAELKLLDIVKQGSNMHISIIRPSLVYGPGVKGNLKLMLSGIKGGWLPSFPKINNKRSMVHVDDLVRALFFVSKNKKANGKIFIVTDGIKYSSQDIYINLCNSIGVKPRSLRLPVTLLRLISIIIPSLRVKLDKLLLDECYSSDKIRGIGFRSEKILKNINETDY